MRPQTAAAAALWIARHGETEWTVGRRHTGTTDVPLTAAGEAQARTLGARLAGRRFAVVLVSPLARATRTAELALPGAELTPDAELREWDYGDYEGVTTAEILRSRPDWDLWRDGCPGGESPADMSVRADRVLARLAAVDGDSLVFGHGHMSRVLAARALGLEAAAGAILLLSTAAISVIGAEHGRRAIELWNDTGRLAP